ncbi:hypothetical protein INR49_011763, partial [Caranx melampygus]
MDYLVNNTPLNWLVGPFYPRVSPESTRAPAPTASSSTPSTPSSSASTQLHREEPMEVEMESLPLQQKQKCTRNSWGLYT